MAIAGQNLTSKRLHRHAVPLVVLSVGLFIVSVAIITAYRQPQTGLSARAVGRVLTDRLVTVQARSPGLVRVSRYRPADEADGRLSLSAAALANDVDQISNAGEQTVLDAATAAPNQINP